MIYKDYETRIKLDSVFKWSYKIQCPLKIKRFKSEIEFEIPCNLQSNIHSINISFNYYHVNIYNHFIYNVDPSGVIEKKYGYLIYEIINDYTLLFNNIKIEEIDYV